MSMADQESISRPFDVVARWMVTERTLSEECKSHNYPREEEESGESQSPEKYFAVEQATKPKRKRDCTVQ